MRPLTRALTLTAALALGLASMSACTGERGSPAAQQRESTRQQQTYERLSAAQPARAMSYSPTRETINFWIDTWSKPGKLSYVYLQASNGQLVGYYIFKGLPVSYCAMLTPPYRWERHDVGESTGDVQVPGPGMDGAYYSGGQCSAYYGRDATTGSYIEYTVGTGISALVYERPLPRQDVEPLGYTQVEDVQ